MRDHALTPELLWEGQSSFGGRLGGPRLSAARGGGSSRGSAVLRMTNLVGGELVGGLWLAVRRLAGGAGSGL